MMSKIEPIRDDLEWLIDNVGGCKQEEVEVNILKAAKSAIDTLTAENERLRELLKRLITLHQVSSPTNDKTLNKCNCTCHLPGHGIYGKCTACEYNHNKYDYGELKIKVSALKGEIHKALKESE